MSTLRRNFFILPTLCSAMILAACGRGSSMHAAPPAPVFTSTPPASALQDNPYSYSIAATDPAGGTVSFALSTGPTGAAVNGSSLSWTPVASQSRLADSFTVTATTSEGGTATQSWMVSPNGTVTVDWVDTNWTENGPVQSPISGNQGLFALVPQPDGSLLALPGSFISPGVLNIPNVPAGYFWLTRSPMQTGGQWTSSSTVDIGHDLLGTPIAGPTSQNTAFDFNLAGLAPVSSSGWLEALTDTFEGLGAFQVQPGSTTLAANVSFLEGPNWSAIDSAFLLQYEPVSLGSFNSLVLGPELTLSNLSLNNTTNNISGTLLASPQVSMDLSVTGTQWVAPLGSVGPTPASLESSYLSVIAEPYISGRNATPGPFGPNFALVMPGQSNPAPLGSDWCLNGSFRSLGFLPVNQLPVTTDTDFGTLQYGDPFPASWTRAVAFCQQAFAPVTVPGVDFIVPYPLVSGIAVAPTASLAPLAPLAGPVQNPMINGASMFTPATLSNAAVSLSWTAPAGTAPYGYLVVPIKVQLDGGTGIGLGPVGEFLTSKTSTTLPPLPAGNMYLFVIETLVDGSANVETSPYRSSLPHAFTQVVSAPITISSGATSPKIRGDARAIKQLFQTQPGTRYRLGVLQH
jgi:hypothetical protein